MVPDLPVDCESILPNMILMKLHSLLQGLTDIKAQSKNCVSMEQTLQILIQNNHLGLLRFLPNFLLDSDPHAQDIIKIVFIFWRKLTENQNTLDKLKTTAFGFPDKLFMDFFCEVDQLLADTCLGEEIAM